MKDQAKRRRQAWGEWAAELRPWNFRGTATFSGRLRGDEWMPSEAATARRLETFFAGLPRAVGRPVDCLAGIEYGTRFGRIHAEVVGYVHGDPFPGMLHLVSAYWEGRDGNGGFHVRALPTGEARVAAARYAVKYAGKQGGRLVVSPGLLPVRALEVRDVAKEFERRRRLSPTALDGNGAG